MQANSEVNRMRKATLIIVDSLITMLALSPIPFAIPVRAHTGSVQRSLRSEAAPKKSVESVPELNDLDPNQSEMRGVIERYTSDRGSLARFYTVDASSARQARMKQFYTEWLATLAKLNFDSMSQDGRIDYLLFKNHLDHELRQLDLQVKAAAEVAALLPFGPTITDLEDTRRRMSPTDPQKIAVLFTGMARQIDATGKAVEAGLKPDAKADAIKAKKTVVYRGVAAVAGLRTTLRNWYGFYNGYDPIFTWWVGEPYKSVDVALEKYAALLREKVLGLNPGDTTEIVGDPIGREALMSELAYEMIPYTPEELVAIANKEYAWCEAEMKRASRELGYGDDWLK